MNNDRAPAGKSGDDKLWIYFVWPNNIILEGQTSPELQLKLVPAKSLMNCENR